ncbi:hypothetical protein L6452_30799 [Arctium lappa]|uniref:Uncharacterized protein n=1 Tax=Arctium lappa TaxID=4217 RepID=A0ACB8ZI71_ARCLA|nr:hypothetical protein L6452_30799 [Arctium lappa]
MNLVLRLHPKTRSSSRCFWFRSTLAALQWRSIKPFSPFTQEEKRKRDDVFGPCQRCGPSDMWCSCCGVFADDLVHLLWRFGDVHLLRRFGPCRREGDGCLVDLVLVVPPFFVSSTLLRYP